MDIGIPTLFLCTIVIALKLSLYLALGALTSKAKQHIVTNRPSPLPPDMITRNKMRDLQNAGTQHPSVQESNQNNMNHIHSMKTTCDIRPSIVQKLKIGKTLTPQGRSALYMALAMAVHFFGYEFARSANVSSFTSSLIGFSNPSAFSMALTCVSPMTFLLLLGYGKQLERRGPRLALRNSTLFCILAMSLSSFLIYLLHIRGIHNDSSYWKLTLPFQHESVTISRIIVWLSFVFQNSYAHLLYTQQWSFIGSVLTAKEGATYFASIAGLSSMSSTVAGAIIPKLVHTFGLWGLLACSSLSLIVCFMLQEMAYDVSEKYDFSPAHDKTKTKPAKTNDAELTRDYDKSTSNQAKTLQNTVGEAEVSHSNHGIVRKAVYLFRRVPILGALFLEVICFQSLVAVIHVCLVTKLKESISNDSERASWSGKFYSAVNGSSGFLQFLILPLFMTKINPKHVWRLMPLIPTFCTLGQSLQNDPSLLLAAVSFFALKSMDYSIRNVVIEIMYVSLDFDSRYLGKEIIGVLGNRLGKSGIGLILTVLPVFVRDLGVVQLSRFAAILSIGWFSSAWYLSRFIQNNKDQDGNLNKKDL